jgi:sortase A
MATSGILLLVDAGLTLVWQEPVSALLAGSQQAALADELPEPRRPVPAEPSDPVLRRLAADHEAATGQGEAWGRIVLPSLGREYVVVEGTDAGSLRKGPGHYPDTPLPGEGGTVAIAGHRTTYLAPFRTIDRLEPGDEIVVEMPWARFTYALEKTEIVAPTDTEVIDRVAHERLVLTACHPLYSATERIVAFAKLEDVAPA